MTELVSIKLYYGPYESYGVIKHRTQRLHGLIEYLSKNNYLVELVLSPHLNRLTVEMRDRQIFQCNIKNLKFAMPAEEDVVCQRIIEAIKLHARIFYNDDNIPKYTHIGKTARLMVQQNIISDVNTLSCEISNPNNSLVSTSTTIDKNIKIIKEQDSREGSKDIVRGDKYYDSSSFDEENESSEVSIEDMSKNIVELDVMEDNKSNSIDLFTTSCHGPCFKTCPPKQISDKPKPLQDDTFE